MFQVTVILVAFHKYFEFKDYVELIPYKRAVLESKEHFATLVESYKEELVGHTDFLQQEKDAVLH